ncbi:hypothetical protein [Halovivax limisalsi]|uniref:hypothetical protein n=1 Tax=Halovivax limisalsi TaxID=1453760 RepID=UPI001FFC59B6|nr:hypothetical protein [Halovivax limisalsi]
MTSDGPKPPNRDPHFDPNLPLTTGNVPRWVALAVVGYMILSLVIAFYVFVL